MALLRGLRSLLFGVVGKMKTYEEEIADHIAKVLGGLPYSEPKSVKAVKKSPAREFLIFYLAKHKIRLNSENKLKSIEGHTLGTHISVAWSKNCLIWIYESNGQLVTQVISMTKIIL
jgi:hypothetical protein